MRCSGRWTPSPTPSSWVVLFYVATTDVPHGSIQAVIRSQLSPKHVPSIIRRVPAAPYNRNLKKMEVLVKLVVDGAPAAAWAPMLDSLADPNGLGPDAIIAPFRVFHEEHEEHR